MSAIALNRNYGLQLPNIFTDVDTAEMEYVDGGFSIERRWYGRVACLNKSDINAIVNVMSGATAAGFTFSGYCWMIGAGLSVPTFGMSVALGNSIAAIAAFSSGLVGVGAWTLSQFNSVTIPLTY